MVINGLSVEKEVNNNILIKRFWISFKTYLENELPRTDLLKDEYIIYDNWNNGSYYLNVDYNYQFKLYYGIDYDESNCFDITYIKMFIELCFFEWVKPEKRYDFTKKVNNLFNQFRLPYKLQKGKIINQGYRTTNFEEKIINYDMLERKILFAEEMILSNELLDKKCALDYIVDSLQYLISIQRGDKLKEKYEDVAEIICGDRTSKKFIVIKNEIEELMKLSNEFFDIRHNEYLNKAKELREPLDDQIFIEYLYNRIYSILYVLKLKYCAKKL